VALSPELFKRLSRLNRQMVSDQLTTGDRVGAAAAQPANAEEEAGPRSLEELIPGQERQAWGGRLYVVQRNVVDLYPAAGRTRAPEQHPPRPGAEAGARPGLHSSPAAGTGENDEEDGEGGGADLVARYRRVLFGSRRAVATDDLHEAIRPLAACDPAGLAYLDIETCGLAGEPLFLVGLMWWTQGNLVVEQLLARDYSEERPVLAATWETLGRIGCLVTFNGKAFDVPAIEARSLASGLFDRHEVPQHVDLLAEARRRWKRVLPNCRLQTIGQLVCGRHRGGDIPGSDIPAAYHEFVRSRQADDPVRRIRSLRRIQTILHHNALDLVTMAELVTHILGGHG